MKKLSEAKSRNELRKNETPAESASASVMVGP